MMDKTLEDRIDAAGRDAVFARAKSLGWTANNPPPKYVWYVIIGELAAHKKTPDAAYDPLRIYDTRPMHEQVTGMRLW